MHNSGRHSLPIHGAVSNGAFAGHYNVARNDRIRTQFGGLFRGYKLNSRNRKSEIHMLDSPEGNALMVKLRSCKLGAERSAFDVICGLASVRNWFLIPSLRIRRRVAEDVEEQGRDDFGGFFLGFPPQADDAFGAGEEVDEAALLGERR